MEVAAESALKAVMKGKEYYFCSQQHKTLFEQRPAAFIGDSL
jgi:YHS domain-containing protein